jgi:signal peptidase II
MESVMQVPQARVWTKWMGLALLVIVLDQLSKIYFNSQYQFGEMRDVIPAISASPDLQPGCSIQLSA